MDVQSDLLLRYQRRLAIAWVLVTMVAEIGFTVVNYRRGLRWGVITDLALVLVSIVLLLLVLHTTRFRLVATISAGALAMLAVMSAKRGLVNGFFWAPIAPFVLFMLAGRGAGIALSGFVFATMAAALVV